MSGANETEFLYKLFLAEKQVEKILQAFAKQFSRDWKLLAKMYYYD